MPTAPPHVRHRLLVELRLTPEGPSLGVEPVHGNDLRDAVAELWFGKCLRKGQPDLPLEAVQPRLRPVFQTQHHERCRGFLLQLDGGPGDPAVMAFGREVVEPVATRARRRLVSEGRLDGDAVPYYELKAEALDDGAIPAPERDQPFVSPGVRTLGVAEPMGVEHETRPLAPLLERARGVQVDERDTRHVVLFAESAWERAERFSRRGGDAEPPVESGAVLVGTLCACPESGEMFTLVRDAVEATAADAATFSLTFSGATWAAIGAVMSARRGRPGAPPELIVGSAHGHNFLPSGGAPPCDACATADVCGRTSASLSLDDECWSRAVFRAQPWQLALVFGLSARGDRVASLYGQQGGVLTRRGHHLLPDAALTGA